MNAVQLENKKKLLRIIFAIQIFFLYDVSFTTDGLNRLCENCMSICCPTLLYLEIGDVPLWEASTPYFTYISESLTKRQYAQIKLEGVQYIEDTELPYVNASDIGITERVEEDLHQKAVEENQNVSQTESVKTEKVVPKQEKRFIYDDEVLKDSDYIRKEFFIEDPTTHIEDDMLDYSRLMGYDAHLKQDNSAPQILIYHTHSQEGYMNSDRTDASTTIMGVGEYLSELLRKQYGFNVIHHLGMYDVESRDYAYSNAAVGIEKVLKENPSIELMIDLHRDEVKAGTKLVTNIDGKDMAKFMFFNGLCYTKQLGKLKNLPNEYIQENVALGFQMELAAKEYYPGLTRKTYLKGYRYNLHYRPKSLLIELGAQTNTLEEAMNSCVPLADIINKVVGVTN